MTLTQAIGIDGKVKVEFVGRDWVLTPDRYIADKDEWLNSRRSLVTILPDGAEIHADGAVATVLRDARGIPEIFVNGKRFERLSNSVVVENFLSDFGHAEIRESKGGCR